jgi:hypothetical protein
MNCFLWLGGVPRVWDDDLTWGKNGESRGMYVPVNTSNRKYHAKRNSRKIQRYMELIKESNKAVLEE